MPNYQLKSEKLLSEEFIKLIKLALPIVGSSILHVLYNLTDMLWVGKLGTGAIAAVGTVGYYIFFAMAISSLIGIGSAIKISHEVGAKNPKASGEYAVASVWGIGLIALASSIVMLFFSKNLIGFFNLQDENVNLQAINYMKIAAFGLVLNYITIAFMSIVNSHGLTKISFRVNIIGVVINIVLDPIFIFTLGLGVEGAALATVISRLMTTIVYLFYFKQSNIAFFNGFAPKFSKLKTIIQISSPTTGKRITFMIISLVLARIIAQWGAGAIAVQRIGVQIESVTFMILWGISQSTSILTGQYYGAKTIHNIKHVYNAGLKISIGIGVTTTLLLVAFPELLMSIFFHETESILMGKGYLIIIGISQVFMCLEMRNEGAFNGLGKTQYPAVVSIIFTALRIPMAIYLGNYTSLALDGIWWSISISSILKGIILFGLFQDVFFGIGKIRNKGLYFKLQNQ